MRFAVDIAKIDKYGFTVSTVLTPRPHLHMQVSRCENGDFWAGEGVSIVFNDDIYPVKNKIIKV